MASEGPIEGTASPHLVRCLHVEPAGGLHHHVRALETVWDGHDEPQRWTLVDAIAAYRSGERFVVDSDADDAPELVPAICPGCRLATLNVDPAGLAPVPICG